MNLLGLLGLGGELLLGEPLVAEELRVHALGGDVLLLLGLLDAVGMSLGSVVVGASVLLLHHFDETGTLRGESGSVQGINEKEGQNGQLREQDKMRDTWPSKQDQSRNDQPRGHRIANPTSHASLWQDNGHAISRNTECSHEPECIRRQGIWGGVGEGRLEAETRLAQDAYPLLTV